jgi:predicted  nucleic acid-binding Zn-ribbon protein
MMGLRSQLSWMVKGQVATQATLESLTRDLQALQLKVAAMETHVGSLAKELPLLRDRQLDEFDKVRAAVTGATDDLMARVDNLRQQIEHR